MDETFTVHFKFYADYDDVEVVNKTYKANPSDTVQDLINNCLPDTCYRLYTKSSGKNSALQRLDMKLNSLSPPSSVSEPYYVVPDKRPKGRLSVMCRTCSCV